MVCASDYALFPTVAHREQLCRCILICSVRGFRGSTCRECLLHLVHFRSTDIFDLHSRAAAQGMRAFVLGSAWVIAGATWLLCVRRLTCPPGSADRVCGLDNTDHLPISCRSVCLLGNSSLAVYPLGHR